jgi:hypothetical protein
MGVNLPAHLVVVKGTRRVGYLWGALCFGGGAPKLVGAVRARRGPWLTSGPLQRVERVLQTSPQPRGHAHIPTNNTPQYVGTGEVARGEGTGYAEYARHEVLQMVGRAGRPQFDTEVGASPNSSAGCAFVLGFSAIRAAFTCAGGVGCIGVWSP